MTGTRVPILQGRRGLFLIIAAGLIYAVVVRYGVARPLLARTHAPVTAGGVEHAPPDPTFACPADPAGTTAAPAWMVHSHSTSSDAKDFVARGWPTGTVSPDGSRLLAVGDGFATTYRLPELEPHLRITYDIPAFEGTGQIAWNRALTRLAILEREQVSVWDLETGRPAGRFTVPPYSDRPAMLLSPDGRLLTIETNVGGAYHLEVREVASGVLLNTIEDHGLLIADDNRHLIAGAERMGRNVSLRVRDLMSGAVVDELAAAEGELETPWGASFVAGTTTPGCVVVVFESVVWGWDLRTNAVVKTPIARLHGPPLTLSPSGRYALYLDNRSGGMHGLGRRNVGESVVARVARSDDPVFFVRSKSDWQDQRLGAAFFTPDEASLVSVDWHGNVHHFAFDSGATLKSTLREDRGPFVLIGLLSLAGLAALAWGLWRLWRNTMSIGKAGV